MCISGPRPSSFWFSGHWRSDHGVAALALLVIPTTDGGPWDFLAPTAVCPRVSRRPCFSGGPRLYWGQHTAAHCPLGVGIKPATPLESFDSSCQRLVSGQTGEKSPRLTGAFKGLWLYQILHTCEHQFPWWEHPPVFASGELGLLVLKSVWLSDTALQALSRQQALLSLPCGFHHLILDRN